MQSVDGIVNKLHYRKIIIKSKWLAMSKFWFIKVTVLMSIEI